MSLLSGSVWGPPPLPDLLVAQLAEHGRNAADAAQCAADIFAQARTAPSATLFVDLGAHKFLGGDIDGAIAAWRHALSSGEPPAAARALLNLGLLYEQLDLHDRAISVLASSGRYQVSPDSSLAQLALARCQHARADHEQAMETLARVAQTLMSEPDRTVELGQTLLALGEVAAAAGRVDRAERAWRAASATPDPATRSAATERLVRLLHELGHDDEIAGLLDGASLAQPGDSTRMVLERAALLAEVGRLDQARQMVGSIAGDGLAMNDRFRLADTRLRLGLVNPAIDELEELLKVADAESQQRAAFGLAEIYRSHEMRQPAEAMYRRVVDGGGYWAGRAERALDATVVVPIGRPGEVPTGQTGDELAAATAAGAAGADARLATDTTEAALDRDGPLSDGEARLGAEEAVAQSLSGAGGGEAPLGVAEAVVVDVLSGAVDDGVFATLPGDSYEGDPPVAEPTTEPVVVLLSSISIDASPQVAGAAVNDHPLAGTAFADALGTLRAGMDATTGGDGDRSDSPFRGVAAAAQAAPPEAREATALANPDDDSNPYAALAPDPFEGDVAPSTRNPYAELAPADLDITDSPAAAAVEEWESLLDDWPDAPIEDQLSDDRLPRSKTGIFSRYI